MDLFKNNYSQIWKNIVVGISRWKKLKLPWLGITAAVKMNCLQRQLCLPWTYIENKILSDWHKQIMNYV